MQLIAEAYHLMKDVIGLSHREMADTFSDWNRGVLDSFLIEITANILRYKVNCPRYSKTMVFCYQNCSDRL